MGEIITAAAKLSAALLPPPETRNAPLPAVETFVAISITPGPAAPFPLASVLADTAIDFGFAVAFSAISRQIPDPSPPDIE